MTKKLLIGSYLALSVHSQPFWSMGEMYCDPYTCTDAKIYLPSKWKNLRVNDFNYFSLFEAHTFNRFTIYINETELIKINYEININREPNNTEKYESDMINELLSKTRFLTCDFEYDLTFWQEENLKEMFNSLYYSKQNLLFREDGVVTKSGNPCTVPTKFTLSQNLNSLSNIKIQNNVDGVLLSMGDNENKKSISLTTALRRYFNPSSNQSDFVNGLAQSHREYAAGKYSGRVIEGLFNRLNNPVLGEVDLELLNNSNILAVWCLIPEEVKTQNFYTHENKGTKKVEREMLGLARDNRTKKLFHFTTKLDKDISVLMQYAESNLQNESEEPPYKKRKTLEN